MVTSQIFEDFSFCLSCKQYDRDKRWCELFKRTMACGCQYGEDKKPRNRFEMVKAMSMEELAEFLEEEITRNPHCKPEKDCTNDDSCIPCWLDWLKEEI